MRFSRLEISDVEMLVSVNAFSFVGDMKDAGPVSRGFVEPPVPLLRSRFGG